LREPAAILYRLGWNINHTNLQKKKRRDLVSQPLLPPACRRKKKRARDDADCGSLFAEAMRRSDAKKKTQPVLSDA